MEHTKKTPETALDIVTMQGQVLQVVSYYKYLGIWLDDCLTFKLQVNKLLKTLRVRLGFSFEARKRLVAVTFLPVLDYRAVPEYSFVGVLFGFQFRYSLLKSPIST